MRLQYACQLAWPSLAWVAELCRDGNEIVVFHGKGVEVRPDWYCEAVWDGEFADGDFDRTDLVAGSGGRLRESGLHLVSSGSTVDRLQALDLGDRVLVSNSLPCLLEQADASLDPAFPGYTTACFSVIKGLDKYVRFVPCSRGQVEFCYFENLHWNGRRLSRLQKPNADRKLDTFADYRGFISGALLRIP